MHFTANRLFHATFNVLVAFLSAAIGATSVGAGGTRERPPDGEFERPADHNLGDIFFSPNGKQLLGVVDVALKKTGTIDIWDVESRKLVHSVADTGLINAAAMTLDGKKLLVSCDDKKYRLFAVPKWTLERTFNNGLVDDRVWRLTMLLGGKGILTVGFGEQMPRLWDVEMQKAIRLQCSAIPIENFAVSKDGKRFAIAYLGPMAEIWDAEALTVIGRVELDKIGSRVITSFAFSPDCETLAAGYLHSVGIHPVTVWNAKTFKKMHDCHCPWKTDNAAHSIIYSSDGKLILASLSPHPTQPNGDIFEKPADIFVWEVKTGKLVYQFNTGSIGGMSIALSPDGRWLVHRGGDYKLRMWDFEKIRREIGK